MSPSSSDDPFTLFAEWFEEADKSEPRDANAMALATVDGDGQPSLRMVLLKGVDARGFVFYTNLESQKGTELAVKPKAALCFYWKSLSRQVRVLGPVRKETQVEISMTEQFKLGIHPPIRQSGDLTNTPGVRVEGAQGTVDLEQGVICAMRHIHMSPGDAIKLGLRDRYTVRVRIGGDRELTYGDVVVRVHPDFRLAMHIDTDEANAAGVSGQAVGEIII